MTTLSSGRELPEYDWFWPIFSRKKENNSDDEENEAGPSSYDTNLNELQIKRLKLNTNSFKKEKECKTFFVYANGKIACEEPLFYEFNEENLENW